ncbi:unnamed protein product [Phyllotreta striolata]|uniref:Uncharacterized protein n=1 Tax=Phyllotreta striolata TaxID=444603 RepID=A0A9N9TX79_PHYSR|nr:unnamed protein product [Phyllotreta striolata]
MNADFKNLIIKNFVELMQNCDVDKLKEPLIRRKLFTPQEIDKIFQSKDDRHNKRLFFFEIQEKPNAFSSLVDALHETSQTDIIHLLIPRGVKVFNNPVWNNNDEQSYLAYVPVNSSSTALDIKIRYSTDFMDTPEYNGAIEFYSSKSKKRGRALIINNYDFEGDEYRNGAEVDDKNLRELFNRLGGWDVDHHCNITAAQMGEVIKKFANNKTNILYDICFVIIMSHGAKMDNDTIIHGIKRADYISVSEIHKIFSNEQCIHWASKPKILTFSVCRGQDLHLPVIQRTESDSLQRTNTAHLRRAEEDTLTCYSTISGYKAHRDFYRGSWYIQLLCQTFMNHACEYPVDTLMMKVDQGLKLIESEKGSVQTAEYTNRGFKRLYLHPGIYFEDNQIKRYFDN